MTCGTRSSVSLSPLPQCILPPHPFPLSRLFALPKRQVTGGRGGAVPAVRQCCGWRLARQCCARGQPLQRWRGGAEGATASPCSGGADDGTRLAPPPPTATPCSGGEALVAAEQDDQRAAEKDGQRVELRRSESISLRFDSSRARFTSTRARFVVPVLDLIWWVSYVEVWRSSHDRSWMSELEL
jgi:hypothetical protein